MQNLRRRLAITLKEEDKLVDYVVSAFRDMFEANAKEKIEDRLAKILSMGVLDDDKVELIYTLKTDVNIIKAKLTEYRRESPKTKGTKQCKTLK